MAFLTLLLLTACEPSATEVSRGRPAPNTSVSSVLDPGEYPKPQPGMFRIVASPKTQRARVGEEVIFTVRVRIPEGAELTPGVKWDDGSKGGIGNAITDCFPPPPGEPDPLEWTWDTRRFDHVFKKPGTFRPTLYLHVSGCGYGKMLRDQISVEVSG